MGDSSGLRAIPGVELFARVLDGFTDIVTLPIRLVTGSATGQRVAGIANGIFGELGGPGADTLPAAMTVRLDGRRVHLARRPLATAFPEASPRVVVFLHGLVETERSWFHAVPPAKSASGADFGSRLADDLSCTPVYLRYHTGRHVFDNGRELAALLAELVENWPVPVADIVLVGHSMGGLVARSAVIQAHEQHLAWLARTSRLVCLGTPHTGALLERVVVRVATFLDGFAVTAPLSRVFALRSDGIKDLGRGQVHPGRRDVRTGDAEAVPVLAFPPNVRQCFVAATLARSEASVWGRLIGDLMVTPTSAGGREESADLRWLGGLNHFDLLRHDTVYDTLLDWLSRPAFH
jgi:pimeloyl-ACP methyl ester carboxylesterase